MIVLCLGFMVPSSANILILTVDKYNEDAVFADGKPDPMPNVSQLVQETPP